MKKLALILSLLVLGISASISAQTNPLWLRYPAISPDGQSIAFTYMSDIYTVPTKGGTALRLTSGTGTEYKPVWSSDGKTIAYASDQFGNFDIFTIQAFGGTPLRLTFHSGSEKPSAFSPDGKLILFSASIQDLAQSAAFPRPYLSELYSVPVNGGRIKQVLATPAEEAKYSKDASKIIYQDSKGPENQWRKHHKSSVTRDLRMYSVADKKHTFLTTYIGEDRDPVFSADETAIYYISDVNSKGMNICKIDLMLPEVPVKISDFKNHPVRFLSVSNDDVLCFSWDGEIYVMKEGKTPLKVNITINTDAGFSRTEFRKESSGATEMAISPDGDEVAFVLRGNVFVTSTEFGSTKQITNTPGAERNVSFSPDGKAILYAAERNGSWNIYQTKRTNDAELNFALSSLLTETPVVETEAEEFQPMFSPDGKEIAYLHERTELKVINIATKATRTVLNGKFNYSYTDGDQAYEWAPDSKSFLVQFSPHSAFTSDIALVKADGSEADKPLNLTPSGYADGSPKWALKGNAMIWFSDREGYRSHGSWGSHSDVYAAFFNQDAYNKFRMTEEEYKLYQKENEKKTSAKKDTTKKEDDVKPLVFELDKLEKRMTRLTINSAAMSDAILTPDGEKLFYMASFEDGFDLWVTDLRKNETKLAAKLSGYGYAMQLDKKGENLFVISGGKILKFDTKSYSQKAVSFTAEYELNRFAERAYMFEHVCRTINKKFYVTDMHGVDWKFYQKEYEKFLPHINNNFDFAEMLSEILGELNASHTGSGYRYSAPNSDQTASLGAFYDYNFTENGLKIVEIIDEGPLANTPVKAGMIIEKIDGIAVEAGKDYFALLNRKVGKRTLLSVFDPAAGKRWDETVKPISLGDENTLLYQRWVEKRRAETKQLSAGRIGYVHIEGMNSASFRQVYSDLLGKHYDDEAVVIDSRYNHGGWLHDDLATLFSGKKYVEFVPRGQSFGTDPMTKWTKPSALLMSEGNYSDGHAFPFVYKTLEIGKIIGMPVPGTMTAVWWETLQDPTVYFGMPQVGTRDNNGNYLENTQLEPDYKVDNDYETIITGRDQQLEKAVQVLLEQLKK